ncbi:DUF4037 domain-containing protein [Kribbella sp. VKM Ac-2571]|uniref:DUF4037 domain-containing protein n=1 Tax=Kribbella sp. VKM Ac-2571 TaxID=2512222 RepID=UPI00192DBEE2|nr:DUF4037 domain-containing protein [Kribbella sp. VKM Ac-2571]
MGDWLRERLGFDASQRVRDALAWYPDQIWRWTLACQWSRIAQEEAFVQRTHEVGDELGSRVVAARLVRDLMRLAMLQARTYAPYSKWLGTAFARLGHPDGLDVALATGPRRCSMLGGSRTRVWRR